MDYLDCPWYYRKEIYNPSEEEILNGDYIGFVYCITDTKNSKKYIGKKTLLSTTKKPPLKGQKRKRKIVKESDWRTYFGSSDTVKSLLNESGHIIFEREILHFCKTKGDLSYMETYEILIRNALILDSYYNEYVGCRINSKHLSDRISLLIP